MRFAEYDGDTDEHSRGQAGEDPKHSRQPI
jgi:hypothetical protein